MARRYSLQNPGPKLAKFLASFSCPQGVAAHYIPDNEFKELCSENNVPASVTFAVHGVPIMPSEVLCGPWTIDEALRSGEWGVHR